MVVENLNIKNFSSPQYPYFSDLVPRLYLLDATTLIPKRSEYGPPLVRERRYIMYAIATGNFEYAAATRQVWYEVSRVSKRKGLGADYMRWLNFVSDENGSIFRTIDLNQLDYRTIYPSLWDHLPRFVGSGEFSTALAALESGISRIVTDDKDFVSQIHQVKKEFAGKWKKNLEVLNTLQLYHKLNPRLMFEKLYRPRHLRI